MALPTSALITWITGLGWNVTQESGAPLIQGPYIPEMPDRLVVITGTPGPGWQIDGAADLTGFQARTRGPQYRPEVSESLAFTLDALILGARFPAVLGNGQVLISVRRLGSQPTPLPAGPDAGDFTDFTCQYLALASQYVPA